MNKIIVEITSEALFTTCDIHYGLEQHFDKTISQVKEITPGLELKDKLHRRNLQIKDLKSQILSNIQVKGNLHSRIDVLEKIVKENNLWEVYCTACDNNK